MNATKVTKHSCNITWEEYEDANWNAPFLLNYNVFVEEVIFKNIAGILIHHILQASIKFNITQRTIIFNYHIINNNISLLDEAAVFFQQQHLSLLLPLLVILVQHR